MHANLPSYTRSGVVSALGGLGPLGPPHLGVADLDQRIIDLVQGHWGFGGFGGSWSSGSYADATTPAERVLVIIDALGKGKLEQGVFDRPQPVVYPVFPGPSPDETPVYTIPIEDDQPEFVGIYGPKAVPEDWDQVYAEYKVLNPEEDVSVFTDLANAATDILQEKYLGAASAPIVVQPLGMAQPMQGGIRGPAATMQTTSVPAKVTVDTATGKVTACRRRRRRRLLTPTDLNDLAALKTIVGGGQAINFAVMKAVRR